MKSTQSDRGLEFDGVGAGSKKGPNRFAGNHWSGHSNDGRSVDFGRGPTKGNEGYHNARGGKSVTKDAFRAAPTDALPGSTKIKNPDYINGGAQVRTPGGTRTWDPKKGQNFAGNPDKIRMKQTGGPDYGGTTKGSKPSVASGRSDFNYGPRSQY